MKKNKIKSMKLESGSINWACKMLVLSFVLSILLSMFSQSFLPSLGIIFSIFTICTFIFLAVFFDMISVAITATSKEELDEFKDQKGYDNAIKLFQKQDKVCSFCGDVVGDICSILSGAGGVSLIINLNLSNPSIVIFLTCLVSSLIAGITIFFKAIMKGYAIKNADKVILKIGQITELKRKNKRIKKTQKSVDKNN